MSDVTLTQTISDTDATDEQVIEACWTELQGLRKQIDEDQLDIVRLQAETGELLKELKATVGL